VVENPIWQALLAEHREGPDKLLSEAERKKVKVCEVGSRVGKPYAEIGRHATEAQASLIIMTAHGGDAVGRAVFGSATYRVIQ